MKKDLAESEKHFKSIELWMLDNETVLDDNLFADITLEEFNSRGIEKLNNKVFSKSTSTMTNFLCLPCDIENSPPNYHIWRTLSAINQLKPLQINLNVIEIPTNTIASTNESTSQLGILILSQPNKRNLIIGTRAFQYFRELYQIDFQFMEITKLEKEIFQFA